MDDFKRYLEKTEEVGFVEKVDHTMAYVSGLPHVHLNEMIFFENGTKGQVISLEKDYVEVLLLTASTIDVGLQAVRMGVNLKVSVTDKILGNSYSPLDLFEAGNSDNTRNVDTTPPGIDQRSAIKEICETGVTVVDLTVPLGRGQRELVIGDRGTGKTLFLMQTLVSQVQKGAIGIYATVGKKKFDIKKLQDFVKKSEISDRTAIVATSSTDPSGLIFLTPYVAMSMAEHFRDQGQDVVLIIDDLTTHAKYYREISLLAKRFPGRSSYPGDIFYTHARLIERAGNFKKGSITCFPVAESVMGDLTGYIQTNLMAMTDGHIFFDASLFDQGRRPAINTFLSVTRVGHQIQSPLAKDMSDHLSKFLVQHEKMKQFMHFGAEITPKVKKILDQGDKLLNLFNQSPNSTIPLNVNILLAAGLWVGVWNEKKIPEMKQDMEELILKYRQDQNFAKEVDKLVTGFDSFEKFTDYLRQEDSVFQNLN